MRTTTRRTISVFLTAALLAVLAGTAFWAAGCGSSPDATPQLLEAVDKTSNLRSIKGDFTAEALKGDQKAAVPLFTLEGTMAVDLTTNSMEMSSTLPVIGTPVGLRIIEGEMYLNMTGKWMSNPESLLGTLGLPALGQTLPTLGELFQLMRYVSQVRPLGSESVGGVDCDRLAIKPDYARVSASDQVPAFLQVLAGGAQAAGEALSKSNLAIEAWVAKDSGLLKQALFSFSLDVPQLPLISMFLPEGPAAFQITIQLSGYNEPVQVEVPQDAKAASPGSLGL